MRARDVVRRNGEASSMLRRREFPPRNFTKRQAPRGDFRNAAGSLMSPRTSHNGIAGQTLRLSGFQRGSTIKIDDMNIATGVRDVE